MPLFLLLISFINIMAAPLPPLPGREIKDSPFIVEDIKTEIQKEETENKQNEMTWFAPKTEEQLSQDQTFIGMEQGAIFVPMMTETRLEPEYTATKTDSASKEYFGKSWKGKNGIRLVVPTGTYVVEVGSGIEDIRKQYSIEVIEGKTTVVKPEWGGLIVNTINEYGELVSESYEIISLIDGESYGKGFGLPQERSNDIKTWLLPPNIYRISRNGENVTSLLNYITVQINSGELTNVELVFEDSTGRLVAGGVKAIKQNVNKNAYWNNGMRLGASVNYTTLVSMNDKKNDIFNYLGDLRLRSVYNRYNIFWFSEFYMRTNLQWLDNNEQDSKWNVVQDFFTIQSSVVYRLKDWVGPYVRASIRSHVLPEKLSKTDTLPLYKLRSSKDSVLITEEEFVLNPPLFPFRIGEGIGLNFQIFGFSGISISAQTGFAARQIFRKNMWIATDKYHTIFEETNRNLYDYGLESSLSASISFLRFFILDLNGELFLPTAIESNGIKIKEFRLEELSADLRFALTRFVEISCNAQVNDMLATGVESSDGTNRFESLITFQLRLYANF